jgi:hypothetical protein
LAGVLIAQVMAMANFYFVLCPVNPRCDSVLDPLTRDSKFSFFNFRLTFSMEFESYLASKRIDSARFRHAEPQLWQSWKSEFEQLHPNSFTVQKLNLINPIRRKYQLVVAEPVKPPAPLNKPALPKPAPPKPAPSVVNTEAQPAVSNGDMPAPAKVVPRIPRPGMPKPVVKASPGANQEPLSTSIQKSSETASDSPATGESQATHVESTTSNSDKVASGAGNDVASLNKVTSGHIEKASDPSQMQDDAEKPGTISDATSSPSPATPPPAAKPAKPVIPRPLIKPKPKPN